MASTSTARSVYEFVSEPPDELHCLICLEVAREPLQHEACGKLFCKECIDEHGRQMPCPNCREYKSSYYLDKRSKRNIEELAVKCINVDKNCEWEGTVGTLNEHVATCQFALVCCPNQCKDDNGLVNNFMRNNMRAHLTKDCPKREYECQYCGKKDTYSEITDVHDKICVKKILPCPNEECTKTMERQKVDEHLKDECEYTEISCKYKSIGCGMKRKRRDMAAHEISSKQMHLDLAMDTTVQLRNELNTVTVQLNRQKTNTFKMPAFDTYKELNAPFESPPFYSAPSGYLMYITVYANGSHDGKGTHISVFAGIKEGKYDDELNWPFVGIISITLLNQLEDKNHHTTVVCGRPENDLKESSRGYSKTISHTALDRDTTRNVQYLKNNTLYFRVQVESVDYKPWLHN